MKDFYSGNINLKNRLLQKGVLDLKAFWQYIDENFFKHSEPEKIEPLTQVNQSIFKYSEIKNEDGRNKDLKENDLNKEITLIENYLQNRLFQKDLKGIFSDLKLEEESILNNSNKEMVLKNLQDQIIFLELAQYAESVTKIERRLKSDNCVRISCDPSDRLPSIILSMDEYKYLWKFRDSSNFLFSLDKSHAQSHIIINNKDTPKNMHRAREKIERRVILKQEDINVDFNLCHNCKMKKPTDLMVQCKNKENFRAPKTFQIYNMSLIRKNERFFIVPNFIGDMKDLVNSINVKHNEENEQRFQKCEKYFCNYCLKGSYQLNVDPIIKPTENTGLANINHVTPNYKLEKEKPPLVKNDSSKLAKPNICLSKDWCCPYCLNDCFCSRCLREDQIFKLIATYFYYEGDLNDLYFNIKMMQNSIIKMLLNLLVVTNLEIKDLGYMDRQCKINQKSSSNNLQTNLESDNNFMNGTTKLSKVNGESKSELRRKRRIGKNFKNNSKFSKSIKNKLTSNEKGNAFQIKLKDYENIMDRCMEVIKTFRKFQKNISERMF